MRRGLLLVVAGLAAAGAWAQAGPPGALVVEAPWSRATPPGVTTGAAFLTVRNRGDAADRLVGASSPAAAAVEIHQTSLVDGEMQMRRRDEATVPARGLLRFEPGGYHLMLVGLKAPLVAGGRVPVTLRFERAGSVVVECPVGPPGAPGPDREAPR